MQVVVGMLVHNERELEPLAEEVERRGQGGTPARNPQEHHHGRNPTAWVVAAAMHVPPCLSTCVYLYSPSNIAWWLYSTLQQMGPT